MFIAKTNEKHFEAAASYIEVRFKNNYSKAAAFIEWCMVDEIAILLRYSLVQGNSDFLEYVLARTDVDTLGSFPYEPPPPLATLPPIKRNEGHETEKEVCGEIYKAELPGSNGKMIVIKNIIQPSKEAMELTEEDSKLLNKKMQQI
ncbi:hypothetical protein SLEP1_g59224 [Rubroshorea leprosula]|uniref:Uncharacterized protein n=1 Tax=Rubroshorea leprosula TaxID=152421 RepID=A0AAV5MVA1_9ROSI|nr:hypothetical protein SLEP1_g59224 [Rubroshorea leprosula]